MAVESSISVMDSLLEKLKLDDPWVPPRSWDSLPYQSGAPSRPPSQSSPPLYATSTVSVITCFPSSLPSCSKWMPFVLHLALAHGIDMEEPSLVRLAMNALQGVESALTSIEKLSSVLRYSSADRTSHRIPNFWTRCSSNVIVGNVLTSIGQSGCIIFLLRRFVSYFTNPNFIGPRELEETVKSDSCEGQCTPPHFSLINQAFAISVGKVIDGYASALNTLSESVSLRRCLKANNGGCFTSIGDSEVTLLEMYLHTMGLRTQIETLGNLCNVNHLTDGFPEWSLEDLRTKADSEFTVFPRSGALLSFLYAQLKVADPAHSALLKFLFLKCYEPYSYFIRSWIYDGVFSDPHHEFAVECVSNISIHALGDPGIPSGSPLPIIQVRDGATVPFFLEECLVPLCRTGQQLQVILKLLEFSSNVGACDTHQEILPTLVGLSSEYPWFAFPLSFDKRTVENMVFARDCYYQRMLEKIENILVKLDFGSQQAAPGVALRLSNNLSRQVSFVEDENLSPLPSVRRDPNVPEDIMGSETSSIMDESPAEDLLESSECSSSESSEEADEAEEVLSMSPYPMPSYLSALDFSLTLSADQKMQNFNQSDISCSMKDLPFKRNRKSGYAAYHSYKQACFGTTEQKPFLALENQVSSTVDDLYLLYDHHTNQGKYDTWSLVPDRGLELNMDYGLLKSDSNDPENASNVCVGSAGQRHCLTRASLRTFDLHFSYLKYDSTYFSKNPTLNRDSFGIPRTMLGESGHASFMNSHFDFTSVEDPLRTCAVKLAGDQGLPLKNEVPQITEIPTASVHTSNTASIVDQNDAVMENDAKLCIDGLSLHKRDSDGESLSQNATGGSAWESLLGRSQKSVSRTVRDPRTLLVSGADMPLDFVIRRCVLDEISLQYKYVSKLAIKLLTEGFKLQEHLQSLRCYHFMEVADWVDLFIMSLWHHKWHVSEVNKRIPEIQGVLELAVQSSSCEGDPNKDRLYVYLKGDGNRHLAASAKGIHSFNFLGLGYRINWPASIILTPVALEIYSEIFNFLIQVKLAIFSLSDAWALLKGYQVKPQKGTVQQIPILTDTRHKVNHFVSALQQYVQSQLSQVSWFRFLDSLNHKVKDMLDLESVHMSYLTESLHICFLSNETRSIARIIQNILQCAMDFQSCLTRSLLCAGSNDEKSPIKYSHVDISQVHTIRNAFNKNLEDLYLIYLQSPKHDEFGLCRFWDYLNYNDYYSGLMSKQDVPLSGVANIVLRHGFLLKDKGLDNVPSP
ncbi:gamma-tubulin complex component [Striga asiatica]|uniref:Gamma-tubulin complex component n=1 Tax=Striga asiatica TaxID=4170 RepID=A0A5A7Q9E2_STRAF|nr:gamma-tubulin complex component [Striga asiatica]